MMEQYSGRRAHYYSPRVLIFASCVNILLSLALLVVGFWLAFRHHINCLTFLEIPIIFIGVALLVFSIMGIVGVERHKVFVVWAYLLLLFLLLLLLLAFTLFAFFVTSGDGGGHQVPGASFKEYKLNDYSQWLQNKVRDATTWLDLRACLKDAQFCKGLNKQYSTLSKFDNAHLSAVQSGCCKPPTACGFTFVKATQWVSATNGGASSDCASWDKNGLCYNCNACKAGLLENVRKSWRKTAKVCLAILILLTLFYLISWAAFLKGSWHGFFTNKPHASVQSPSTP